MPGYTRQMKMETYQGEEALEKRVHQLLVDRVNFELEHNFHGGSVLMVEVKREYSE